MRPALVVTWKECLDLVRDRRTMANVFFMGALLGPLLAMGILAMAIGMILEEAQKDLVVPTAGAEHAPSLVRHLERRGISVKSDAGDLEARVARQTVEVALRIPESYQTDFGRGASAIVEVIYDESRTKSQVQGDRVGATIEEYAAITGRLRLMMRGIDPDIVEPVAVRYQDVAPAAADGAGRMLFMLPYFLIMGLIQASMFIAADLTAGERERQSLEPLLINPVSPSAVVLGKIAVNALVCLLVVLISSGAFVLGSKALPAEEIGLVIESVIFFQVMLGLVPLVLFIAPLMTFLGAYARSVREAQTWLSVVLLLAILPVVVQMISQAKPADWQLAFPLWSQQYLLNELFKGSLVDPRAWIISAAGSVGLGLVATWFAVRQYHKPKLVFSGN